MKRLLVLPPLVMLLGGCAAGGTTATPTVTVTSYVEAPAPTVTVTPPTEVAAPSTVVFEALGEGKANVTWTSDGTVSQEDVDLPFRTEFAPGTITIAVVQRMSGAVGCRLLVDGEVLDEKPLQEGQVLAQCKLD